VKFGPVTPEFTRLECVQQTSIITGVSFTTFARGRHCSYYGDQYSVLFHYCSLGGRHC